MNLKDFKAKALQNQKIRKEFERYDLAFEIGQMVLEARLFKGVTQQKLAGKLGTQQPSIARLENGQSLPSLTFLEKVARALGTYLLAPKFAFLEKPASQNSSKIKTMVITVMPSIKTETVTPSWLEAKSPAFSSSFLNLQSL